jgi:hypothetical protein
MTRSKLREHLLHRDHDGRYSLLSHNTSLHTMPNSIHMQLTGVGSVKREALAIDISKRRTPSRIIGIGLLFKLMARHRRQFVHTGLLEAEFIHTFGEVERTHIARFVFLGKVLEETNIENDLT